MKKFLCSTLILLNYGLIQALPIGNPSEASLFTCSVFSPGPPGNPCDPCYSWFDAWSLRIGYSGDFVFNRNLQLDGEGFGHGKTIQVTKLNTNSGYLALNIYNKIDIFGTLGASKLSITTNDTSWQAVAGTQGQLDWETYFSWSAGVRATLIRCKCFMVGIEGQYFQTDPHLTTYLNTSSGLYNYFNDENRMRYQDWQVGLGASYTLRTFSPKISMVPYAGMKWGWARLRTGHFEFVRTDTTETLTIFNLKAKKVWGYALGVTMTICDRMGLTIEGRWADEKAIYTNAQFRF